MSHRIRKASSTNVRLIMSVNRKLISLYYDHCFKKNRKRLVILNYKKYWYIRQWRDVD